jgi:DNA processing protein
LPHEPPRAWQVRARNRIVAGLADAVVVVEGSAGSGALLTAEAAAERGTAVLAVPGDVRAPNSAGPHRLLAEGAAPCTEPADVLRVLPRGGTRPTIGDAAATAGSGTASASLLPDTLAEALRAAWPRPLRLEQLVERTGLPSARLLAAVTRARAAGELAEGAEGVRLRRAP